MCLKPWNIIIYMTSDFSTTWSYFQPCMIIKQILNRTWSIFIWNSLISEWPSNSHGHLFSSTHLLLSFNICIYLINLIQSYQYLCIYMVSKLILRYKSWCWDFFAQSFHVWPVGGASWEWLNDYFSRDIRNTCYP